MNDAAEDSNFPAERRADRGEIVVKTFLKCLFLSCGYSFAITNL